MPMYGWNGSWHMGWMALWWIVAIAILVAVVWSFGKSRDEVADSPETVLKRRYANGEIDQETYHRMLEELRK